MIALWMAYATLVALLLGSAGHALETAIRVRGGRTRWVWAGALAASWLVPISAASLRVLDPTVLAGPLGLRDFSSRESMIEAISNSGPPMAVARLSDVLRNIQLLLDPWNGVLLGIWLVLATGGLLVLLLSARHMANKVKSWPSDGIQGVAVRLSPDFGPALVGVHRPIIVVPAWIMALDDPQQRLVLRHEMEHRAARDTLLLLAGALLTLAAPWNPALWWHLRRLRLAVEVDCDARVLSRGESPRSYGRLLLGLGARPSGWALSVATLAEPRSLLERRLEMITSRDRGGWKLVPGLLAAVILVAFACETPAPTASNEDAPVARTEAGSGEVVGDDSFPAPGSAQGEALDVARVRARRAEGSDDGDGDPLYFVDGVETRELVGLDPHDIESISVLKDGSAVERYGARAVNGVILVSTKAGSGDGSAPGP